MNLNKIYIALLLLVSAPCYAADVERSQLVALYRGEVLAGNSVVEFVSHNDPSGVYATKHCEELRAVYSKRDRIPYYCSPVIFEEFRPRLK